MVGRSTGTSTPLNFEIGAEHARSRLSARRQSPTRDHVQQRFVDVAAPPVVLPIVEAVDRSVDQGVLVLYRSLDHGT